MDGWMDGWIEWEGREGADLYEVGHLGVLVEALVVDVEELFGLFDGVGVGGQLHFERHRRRDDAHRVALDHRQRHNDLLVET